MKPIEELNISPWPWSLESYETTDTHYVIDFIDQEVVRFCKKSSGKKNARIMSAAPDMYECLLEAVEDKCRKCKAEWYGECVTADGKDCEMVAKWKSVLAKAAGEETT